MITSGNPRANKQLLLSFAIAAVVLLATTVALLGANGFDLRAKAARPKTAGEVKKALRTKSNGDDCSRSGGVWIQVGNRATNTNGYCRPPNPTNPPKPFSAPQSPPTAAPTKFLQQINHP
jgi:hypothetical protein